MLTSKTKLKDLEDYKAFSEWRLNDPYPLMHRLRTEDPNHWNEHIGGWMVTSYDDVVNAYRDPRLISDRASINMKSLPEPLQNKYQTLGEHVSNWLGFTDAPKHTRLRKIVGKAFTPTVTLNLQLLKIIEGFFSKPYMTTYSKLLNNVFSSSRNGP